MGNLLWPGDLPAAHDVALSDALSAVRARGYWASPFPEGDGVTFHREDRSAYEPDRALADFREAFPFLAIEPLGEKESPSKVLARLAGDRKALCRYLMPVEGLRLHSRFDLGMTRFHPPVDGVDHTLSDHAWRELCDVPGADVDPNWTPRYGETGTTGLLAYPLIERTIEVPLSIFYGASASYDEQSPLLRLLMEDADHALDPIRFEYCHYHKLHYLPAKPGWIGDTSIVHLMPDTRALKARLIQGKAYVLRVSNNWLGLEVDEGAVGGPNPLADIVDSADNHETTLALKAALRAWNRSFYLVELEASFLHLVYAIDALRAPEHLKGDRHRLWILAFASASNPARFAALFDDFDRHYRTRNKIVHEGQTFAGLGLVGEEQCQFMLGVLGSCIRTFLRECFGDRRKAMDFAFDKLMSAALAPTITSLASSQFTLPLTSDKGFKYHMQP